MDDMTRRRFGQTLAGGALALAAGSVGARVGREPLVLGEGEHRYECVHDWIKPPSGMHFGDTHGLCQDSAGNIYVAHTVHGSSERHDAVCVFDRQGRPVRSFGASFKGGAHGLDIRAEDDGEYLYHCDTRRRLVIKSDLDGAVVYEIDYPEASGVYPSRDRWCPTNVAFAPDGGIYVGDGYGSSFIHRFDASGQYMKTVAGPGSDKGQVSCPHGLWLDERRGEARLAVADRSNRRIQYLSLDGEHIGFVTESMRRPCHFKTRGDLLLVPDLDSVVTLLDRDDQAVAKLGDGHPTKLRGAERSAFLPGKFIHPHDAIFLDTGDILVAEWVPIGRVTLLRRLG